MSIKALLEDLPRSMPLAEILQRLENSEAASTEGTLLRRASIPRWFDQETYEKVLAHDLPELPFRRFVQRPEVRKAHVAGMYCLSEEARKSGLSRWPVGGSLRAFARKLHAHYKRRGDAENALACLLYADPAAAAAAFELAYREADRVFDYAKLDDLLCLLRDRSPLDPVLTQVLNDREQYYQSRVLHSGDWVRSAGFMERRFLTAEFNKYFRGRSAWLMHLHAPGGSGKTAFLQWLVSRYAIVERGPKRRRIPVAKVDLDAVELGLVRRWPWLLLAPAIEQLNIQIPGNPFESLLPELQPVQPHIRRTRGGQTSGGVKAIEQVAASIGPYVYGQFAECLRDAKCLLIVDTVEELMIHQPDQFNAFLKELSGIQEKCRGLHVLIAGRYALPTAEPGNGRAESSFLDDQFRGLSEELGKKIVPVFVKPFTPGESKRYLRQRELPAGLPVAKIHRASRGNPFKLSLFADLAETEDGLHEEDFLHPEINYLLRRVIERIPEEEMALRWTLRYACIPKRLTAEFFDAVLKPRLERELAGAAERLDAPEKGLPAKARNPWRYVEGGKVDREALWTGLRKYAGPRSWILFEGDIPSIQSEVAVPMRSLLRGQEVYRELHSAAIAYFEELARSADEDGDAAACEALYHAFQRDGARAEAYWRGAFAEAGANLRRRRALAARLVSGDFLDDAGNPLTDPERSEALVNRKILAEARVELASEAVSAANITSKNVQLGRLEEATRQLEYFDRLKRGSTEPLAEPGRVAYLRAMVAEGRRDGAEVLRITRPFLKRPQDTPYGPLFLLLYAGYCGKPPEAVSELYDQAIAGLAAQTNPIASPVEIYRAKARLWLNDCDLARADRTCEEAIAALPSRSGEFVKIRLELARACASSERVAKLLEMYSPERRERFWNNGFLRLAEGQAAYWRSETNSPPHSSDDEELTGWAILRARALGKLARFDEAFDLLDRIRAQHKSQRPDLLSALSLEAARIVVEDSGATQKGRSLIDLEGVVGEYRLRLKLLQLQAEFQKPARTAVWKREIEKRLFPELTQREKSVALGYWIALGSPSQKDCEEFVRLLRKTKPVAARYPLLHPYMWAIAGRHPKLETGDLLPDPNEGADFFHHALPLASFLFYQGRKERAKDLSTRALAAAGDNPELLLPAVRIARRCGAVPSPERVQALAEAARKVYPREPALAACLMMELAYSSVLNRDRRSASELHKSAMEFAKGASLRFEGRYKGLELQTKKWLQRAPKGDPEQERKPVDHGALVVRVRWVHDTSLEWTGTDGAGRKVFRTEWLSFTRSRDPLALSAQPWTQHLEKYRLTAPRRDFRLVVPAELSGIPFEVLAVRDKRFWFRDLEEGESELSVSQSAVYMTEESRAMETRKDVLLLQDPLDSQRRRKRGYGAVGIDVPQYFGGSLKLAAASPGLAEDLRRCQPKLIWLCGEFQRLGSENTLFFPGFEAGFSVHALLRAIRAAGLREPPVVFLDVPHDPSINKSLFLRNHFADALYRQDAARSVLAGGFLPPAALPHFLDRMSIALRSSQSERELTIALGSLAAAPPALFSTDPSKPIV